MKELEGQEGKSDAISRRENREIRRTLLARGGEDGNQLGGEQGGHVEVGRICIGRWRGDGRAALRAAFKAMLQE